MDVAINFRPYYDLFCSTKTKLQLGSKSRNHVISDFLLKLTDWTNNCNGQFSVMANGYDTILLDQNTKDKTMALA